MTRQCLFDSYVASQLILVYQKVQKKQIDLFLDIYKISIFQNKTKYSNRSKSEAI